MDLRYYNMLHSLDLAGYLYYTYMPTTISLGVKVSPYLLLNVLIAHSRLLCVPWAILPH